MALAIVLVAAAVLLIHLTRGTLFWLDEWQWILHRRGGSVGSYLDPHNEHLVLIPVALYKLLFATFGLASYLPYRILIVVAHLTCATLLFVYARRRVGAAAALIAAAALLMLGPAWENFLWPFQTSFVLSLAAGIGALLLLDRSDRRGDPGACILVAVSLASSGIGLPVAAGVAVDLIGRRRWRDGWIVAGPLALYAAWWIGFQSAGTSAHSVLAAPKFMVKEASAAFASLFGLSGNTALDGPGTLLRWGAPLLVIAVAALAWRLWKTRTVPPRALSIGTMLVAFWALSALGRAALGNPYSGRYIYVGVLLILLLAAELARGWRPGVLAGGAMAAVAVATIVSNIGALRSGAEGLRAYGQFTAASLGALDIGRPAVRPDYVLHEIPGYPFLIVPARLYFAAADADGDPAASQATIASDPESVRAAVDAELIGAERIALQERRQITLCDVHGVISGGGVAPGTTVLVEPSGGPVAVTIRRYADAFQPLGRVAAGRSASLTFPVDRSSRRWVLRAPGAVVCRL